MEFKTPKQKHTNEDNSIPEQQTPVEESSPTEQRKEENIPKKTPVLPVLKYSEPKWSGVPNRGYFLTVLKDGREMEKIDLSKRSKTVFGRVEGCDVILEHPTISRFHAVLQYNLGAEGNDPEGFYLFDLGSTHGSKVNKQSVPTQTYVLVRTGHLIRFGESTRLYILEAQDGYQVEVELEAEKEIEDFTKQKEEIEKKESFVSWGIETDESVATELGSTEGEFYNKDPKRYLKDFFEREGLDMKFESDQISCGKNRIGFTVKLQLPLEDGVGRPLFAEITMEGKKREAVKACCMQACRILDSSGILRESNYVSSRKRKSAIRAENDYYSSDEDSFLDRTGELEGKREKRMKKDGKTELGSGRVENYSSLQKKLKEIQTEILNLEQQMKAKNSHTSETVEDLDQFMIELNSNSNTKSLSKLKFKLEQLRSEETRLNDLVEIVKPNEIMLSPIPEISDKSSNLSEENVGYGLKLAPENRKQEYLERSADKTAEMETPETLANPEKRVYTVELPPHLKAILECKTEEKGSADKTDTSQPEGDYVDWVPPTDQSGDGTTKLNDELGY